MGKNCICLVPHTHWDREWYFTSAKSKIYLVNNMQEILEMLESNPNYPCYVLDGQSVVLFDYLSVMPEDENRIKKLVEANRLKIGPWYTQTDEMVVGSESIVRNLLYGKLDCEKFGNRMMIGYLPDSFGQSAAMPKILNGFGIEKSLFWRGYSERLDVTETEFKWIADDGSEVVVQLLPINYSVGITMPNNAQDLHKQLDENLEKLSKYSTTGQLLVPNGHDQMPIQQNIYEIIDLIKTEYPQYDVKLCAYEDLYKDIDINSIKTIKGELLDGKYMRAHRSIFSSRADLKTLNTRIENKITNVLEPIACVANSLGIAYQAGTIEEIWRNMLKNHAHDSICCCCTDKVNKQVERRFNVAEDLADNLIDFYMRQIIENSEGENKKMIIFNTCPENKNETFKVQVITLFDFFNLVDANNKNIDYEIINHDEIIARDESGKAPVKYHKFQIAMQDEIPAMGYKIYDIVNSDDKKNSIKNTNSTIIENDFFKIDINKNGSLNIEDKNSKEVYKNVLMLQDSADGGDSYDYSPIENDWILTTENVKANIQTNKCSYFEEAKISYKFGIPKDEKSRLEKNINGYMNVEILVTLDKTSPIIKLSININNQAKDHRVRLLIPQNLSAKNSIADIQFGKLKRDTYDNAVEVWQKENWDEKPDPIYPLLSYVHTDVQNGLLVLSNSVREFEIIDGQNSYDTIAITLFRSYGHQGRADLLRRPGRASGTIEATPDAQLIGENTYELALSSDIENAAWQAKNYTTGHVSYSWDPREDLLLNSQNLKIPKLYSLLEFENSAIILSAFKKLENQKGFCIRLYNTNENNEILNIKSLLKITNELMLDETIKKEVNEVLDFKPFEIKTLMLS